MRKYEKNGPLSVHAIAGAYVVLLGIDMTQEASAGILGFAIERLDHVTEQKVWLSGFKSFRESGLPHGALVTTWEHPLQTFLWSDFSARNGHKYSYRVVAMRGTAGNLTEGESVEVTVQTENEKDAMHSVYFNRGVAGSRAYTRKFGNRRPHDVPDRAAWQWLSRGLFKAMLDFIGQAKNEEFGLRAAVYEFNQGGVLQAFARARNAGADVKIVYDARQVIHATDPEKSKLEPAHSNATAISTAGLEECCTPRTSDPRAISHNKFIILLKNGQPIQVLTGSTNMTEGGIFGHSNLVHIVRDPAVAAKYMEYWTKLSEDPQMARRADEDKIRPWNEHHSPLPNDEEGVRAVFSPRRSLDALKWYANEMDNAESAVFLTAAFGVNDLFEEVLAEPRDYLRYVLLESEDEDMETLLSSPNNRVVVGNLLSGDNVFDIWLREQRLLRERLTGLNRHVKYIHTKYMLIDPLGENPTTISGSANFSDASTQRNDENMLIIRGDPRVADIYLGEFMRLFKHFQFRSAVRSGLAGANSDVGYLENDDRWLTPFYDETKIQAKERIYFSGKPLS